MNMSVEIIGLRADNGQNWINLVKHEKLLTVAYNWNISITDLKKSILRYILTAVSSP